LHVAVGDLFWFLRIRSRTQRQSGSDLAYWRSRLGFANFSLRSPPFAFLRGVFPI